MNALISPDTNFSLARPSLNLSNASTENIPGTIASNGVDFFSVWTGVASRRTNIFTNTTATLEALTAPTLVTPNVDANLPSTTVDFSWAHPGGTGIQYTLQLAPMGGTLADVATCQNVTSTMCRVSTGLSFGQTYQWRVKAFDSRYRGREIFSTETRTFRLSLDALAAPVLVNPSSSASLTSNTVDFSWTHPGGAGIQYTLQLGQTGMPIVDVPTCQNITTLTCQVSGLSFGQSYQWRITARDSTMPSRTSVSAETRSFNLAVETLAAPVLLNPSASSILSSNEADFSWSHPGGASIQFTLQLGVAGSEPADVPSCQNIPATSCHITGLMWGQTYQWRVTARDSAMPLRTSVSAETRNFSLIGTLSVPSLVSPDNAAILNMNTVTLRWTPLSARPGLVYDVFVDDISAGSSTPFIRRTAITTNTTDLTGLLGNHDYQWWIVARDASGMSVESDSRRNFHVNDLNPPSAPGLAAQPANGVTWAPTRLYLSWTGSTDIDPGDSITGYDVYFVEGSTIPSDACPYKRVSATTTNFIIQASTDGRAAYVPDMTAPAGLSCSMTSGGTRPIYLQAPDTGMMTRTYSWKICSVNNHNVRTCSETRQFNTDDSVVGWWRFDENPTGPVCPRGLGGATAPGGDAGETVCDYSGKGNHGVPRGNPMWLPPVMGSMAGMLGGALQFDGVDDWVEVANSASLNPTRSITLQSYHTLTPGASVWSMFEKITSTSTTDRAGYYLAYGYGAVNLYFGVGANISGGITLPSPIISTQKQFTASYDGTNIKIYSDSMLISTIPSAMPVNTTSRALWLGSSLRTTGIDYSRAQYDDMLIYLKGLSSEEIQNSFLSR